MPNSFQAFFAHEPFWAITITLLMALPILGAVAWVILRAFRKPSGNPNEDKTIF
jgi:hypothetical protein